jgi:hypothetical protein
MAINHPVYVIEPTVYVNADIEVVDDADKPIKLDLSYKYVVFYSDDEEEMSDEEEEYSDEEEEQDVCDFPIGLSGKALIDWCVNDICEKMLNDGFPESFVVEKRAEIERAYLKKIMESL